MILDLIIQPYLSLSDVAVLEVAVANKSMRAVFYAGIISRINIPTMSERNLRSRSSSTMTPFINGITWQRNNTKVIISKSSVADWLRYRNIQVECLHISLCDVRNNITLRHCQDLRELYLSNRLDAAEVQQIIKDVVPFFRKLENIYVNNLDSSILTFLSKHCPNLTMIEGGGVHPLGNHTISLIDTMKLLPQLRGLALCILYKDLHINDVVYPNILSFSYHNDDNQVTVENLITLSRSFPNLTYLEIWKAKFSLSVITALINEYPHIPIFPKLVEISFALHVGGDGLGTLLSVLPNLRKIKVLTCNQASPPMFDNVIIEIMKTCNHLVEFVCSRKINFGGDDMLTRLNNNILAQIIIKSSLKKLTLSDAVIDKFICPVESIYVEELTLINCVIRSNTLFLQSISRNLHVITFTSCTDLSPDDLRQVASSMMKKHATIHLIDCDLLDEGDVYAVSVDFPYIRILNDMF